MFPLSKTEWAAVLTILGLLALCFYGLYLGEKEWEQFRVEHNCKIVGKQSSTVAPGVGVSGNGNAVSTVTVIPGKTGYLCDDGITYWR